MNNSKTSLQGFDPRGFGKRLQSARKALGITQEELAERLRVDRNHVTRMERGIRVCSIDLLVDMAVLLDVSTDYLHGLSADGYSGHQLNKAEAAHSP